MERINKTIHLKYTGTLSLRSVFVDRAERNMKGKSKEEIREEQRARELAMAWEEAERGE